MSVCFLPSDLEGPGSYRCLFPALHLLRAGHQVTLSKATPIKTEKGHRFIVELPEPDSADVFIVHRRFEAAVYEWAMQAQAEGKVIVASTDDNDAELPPWHSAFGRGTGATVDRKHWHRLLRDADFLLCSTPALKKAYRRHNPRSFVIPNYLEWAMWKDVPPRPERPTRLRVGWLGAPGLRLGDLQVLDWLAGWLEANPEVDFVSAGDEATHDLLGIPEAQRVTIPGIDFHERRLPEMLDFDIGLVPLASCAFNESKSDLKGKEYNACGIPVLASPTRSYRDWIVPGDNGFLCEGAGDWVARLDLLVADSGLRRRMADAARARAREASLDRHVGEWQDFLAAVGDRGNDRPAESRKSLGIGFPFAA